MQLARQGIEAVVMGADVVVGELVFHDAHDGLVAQEHVGVAGWSQAEANLLCSPTAATKVVSTLQETAVSDVSCLHRQVLMPNARIGSALLWLDAQSVPSHRKSTEVTVRGPLASGED